MTKAGIFTVLPLAVLAAIGALVAGCGAPSPPPENAPQTERVSDAFRKGPTVDEATLPDPSELLDVSERETTPISEMSRGAEWNFAGTTAQIPDNAWISGTYRELCVIEPCIATPAWILEDTGGNRVFVDANGLVAIVEGENFMHEVLAVHERVILAEQNAAHGR